MRNTIAAAISCLAINTSLSQEAVPPSLEQELGANGSAEVIVLMKEPPTGAAAAVVQAFDDPSTFFFGSMDFGGDKKLEGRNLGIDGAVVAKVDRQQFDELNNHLFVALVAPNRSHPPTLTETISLSEFDVFQSSPTAAGTGSDEAPLAVAVLDTGFDTTHEFLKDKVVGQACYSRERPAEGVESLCKHGEVLENGDVVDLSSEAATFCPWR